VIGRDGRAKRTVDIEVGGSPMIHDMSLTDRHVIFYDLPVTFDVARAVEMAVPRPLRGAGERILAALLGRVPFPQSISSALTGRTLASSSLPYSWNRNYPARVGVMPRDGGASDVRWFDVKPCYVFHPLNAYEDGDSIVIDLIRHEKVFDADVIGPDETPATLDRWTIDLDAGCVREARLDDRPQEFPRVDERRTGLRHRYGYTIGLEAADGSPPSDTILKHDFTNGGSVTRSFGAGKQVSEFVFEPASATSVEDDGVLMGFVYDPAAARSDLMLLDADTLETVASIHLPDRVPAGFHGNWIPAALR
jgi:carotenoid cleavage dioxygenase